MSHIEPRETNRGVPPSMAARGAVFTPTDPCSISGYPPPSQYVLPAPSGCRPDADIEAINAGGDEGLHFLEHLQKT